MARRFRIHLFGQEINPETYAICKADLLLKGEGDEAENIVGGADKSTLSADQLPLARVRLHALQPALRQELEDRPGAHGRQEGHSTTRASSFSTAATQNSSLITRSSDGQLMFLVNKLPR